MTDKTTNGNARQRTRAQERADAVTTPSRLELLGRAEALQKELDAAREQADENLRSWQRTAADFSNYKRRTDEERASVAQFSTALLINRLLGVLDDFDRAIENVPAEAHESWVEGVRLVDRKLRNVLDSEGVTPIDVVGQPFDPNVAEAVVHEETTEHPDNQVIGELQRGYRLHDRVIRPALVRVANNSKER